MGVDALSLRAFRNHRESRIEARGASCVMLEGPNGAGKTGVLEALHLLSTGAGIRPGRSKEMIRFGDSGFRIDAELSTGISLGIKCMENSPLVAYQDGVPLARWLDIVGRIRSTLLRPEDIRMVEEGPEHRRRFLNIMISQMDRGYLEALRRFKRAMKQRQASLAGDAALRRSFSAPMIDEMERIFRTREAAVIGLADRIGVVADAFGIAERIALRYRPAVPKRGEGLSWRDRAEICAREGERLEASGAPNLFGPQRDDLEILWGGKSLRRYGSQGQKRALALALRFAEAETLSGSDHASIVLVDDVFGELDRDRYERLLSHLGRLKSQIWIATTESESLARQWPLARNFRVLAGVVTGVASPL